MSRDAGAGQDTKYKNIGYGLDFRHINYNIQTIFKSDEFQLEVKQSYFQILVYVGTSRRQLS